MQFFIPGAPDNEAAEQMYSKITKSAKGSFAHSPSERRIFSITFVENDQTITAEVGKITVNQETVVAILDIGNYLICTPSYGVMRGIPAIVGRDEVISFTDFD